MSTVQEVGHGPGQAISDVDAGNRYENHLRGTDGSEIAQGSRWCDCYGNLYLPQSRHESDRVTQQCLVETRSLTGRQWWAQARFGLARERLLGHNHNDRD
jgi:hypothetical protein